jgi:hypothetical protein
MFLKKKFMINSFKILSILLVVMLFGLFMSLVATGEGIDTKNQENNKFSIFKTKHHKICYKKESLEEKTLPCDRSCYIYYLGALVLGAYVNFSKLQKIGPI